MEKIEGKYGIYAQVLQHSISPAGVNIITMEISYPRIILAELNTHRMIAKNSSSSRAIPFAKMQKQLTGRPVRFGAANKGMQDTGEDFTNPIEIWYEECGGDIELFTPEGAWDEAKKQALERSRNFAEAGYHKQIYNRLTEPFQMMKTVVTWTEGANFFWLRNHEAADPSLAELARVMYEAAKKSEPELLQPGEWHLPYVQSIRQDNGALRYFIYPKVEPEGKMDLTMGDMTLLTDDEAIKVSSARTAAVSFRNIDYGVVKSEEVFARLVGDERIHGSATEHQATPMQPSFRYLNPELGPNLNFPFDPLSWEPGITHMTKDGSLWSGPFRGWIQYRKLIPGENKEGFI